MGGSQGTVDDPEPEACLSEANMGEKVENRYKDNVTQNTFMDVFKCQKTID